MHAGEVYKLLDKARREGNTLFAMLIDPDKTAEESTHTNVLENAILPDLLLVGSSLLYQRSIEFGIKAARKMGNIPVVIFPGETLQVSKEADAIFLLSVVSGRNPELLIGRHVQAAGLLKKSGLEIIPVAYMLIDGGQNSSVSYMTQTQPIPAEKTDIALATAVASELLGLKAIYLEAGSGAKNHIPIEMIRAIKAEVNIPLIVGGGIREPEIAKQIAMAGADMIVVGNAIEEFPEKLTELILSSKNITPKA